MKNTLEGINNRLNDKDIQSSQNQWHWTQKRRKRNEASLGDFWDNIKSANTCNMGVPEGEERDKGAEDIFEDIMAENLPKLGKELDIQVQEV